MDLGLKGRVAAVAAASKGLGRAVATELAREGADLAICARNQEPLQAARKELEASGGRVHATALDVTASGEAERFVEEAASAYGRLDILVCNVGGPPSGPFVDKDVDDFRRALEQNLLTFIRLTRAALPHLQANGWGRIVMITSSSSKEPIPGLILGNTARTGIGGFAKTLSMELARAGITVNIVAPGPFLTDRQRELAEQRAQREGIAVEQALSDMERIVPMGRIGDPSELGALVAFLCSERASFITGTTIQADGGMTRSLL
jgi:3-oxoacyl-[acyl-carrier protein] reductase